ncbi:hypothetical protein DPMN_103052 [Dreissena polymorpha]|uniref:Uncharacterized protein n=1 Tax=Dreissena polymorpha TaxID=45954 RepID=A0A9D4H769_DREPO|nr:hypothetical protein DPMN_103052 [Dreissena polymorpha]
MPTADDELAMTIAWVFSKNSLAKNHLLPVIVYEMKLTNVFPIIADWTDNTQWCHSEEGSVHVGSSSPYAQLQVKGNHLVAQIVCLECRQLC